MTEPEREPGELDQTVTVPLASSARASLQPAVTPPTPAPRPVIPPPPGPDPLDAPSSAARRGGFTGDRAAASEAMPSAAPARSARPAGPTRPFEHLPEVPGYLIEGPLGHGGMAEVYKAQRIGGVGVSVPCVIKTIISGKQDDRRFQDKFLAEARIHAQMQHPNLVQVLDVGEAGGRLYLVMEWVEGLDVSQLIRHARRRQGDLPLRHLLFILRQTLQGLHHAHTQRGSGFVHRDISPGNILISRQGAVKLADFGVARSIESLANSRQRTLAGKLHYFAPELITGRGGATVQSDVFSMGVTLWEMLTCRPLFDRKGSWTDLQQTISRFDPRALLENELTVPEGLEDVVLRALAPHPGDRYASALEFLEDVSDYAYESGLRLLDAHFAAYIERVLAQRAEAGR